MRAAGGRCVGGGARLLESVVRPRVAVRPEGASRAGVVRPFDAPYNPENASFQVCTARPIVTAAAHVGPARRILRLDLARALHVE